jgi:hypothetical protein
MKTSSRRAKPPVNCLWQDGSIPLFSPLWTCNKIRYDKDIGILCLHSDRIYDNLILGIHTMSIWFWP